MSTPTPARRRPRLPIVLGCSVAAIAVVALLWDWNWFKPLVESKASETLGREVKIGRFDVHLFRRNPVIEIDDMTIANPPEFKSDSRFGSIGKLAVAIDPLPLFHHVVDLTAVEIDQPKGDLGPGPNGKPNWLFPGLAKPAAPGPKSAWSTNVGALAVHGGDIHIVDPQFKSDFVIHVDTQAASEPGGEDHLMVTAKGTYSGQPITGRFVGGSVLSLRDEKKPYPVDLRVENGPTKVVLVGTVSQPTTFGGANLDLDFRGADMAQLGPLIGVPLAPTPPYHVHGKLDYADKRIRFRDFTGTVGKSDLSGTIAVDPGQERPKMTADLVSKRVDMVDLGGFIGAAPGTADNPGQTAKQKQEHAKQASDHNLFPTTPINLPAIRAADFDVRYTAQHIEGKAMPLDNIKAHLLIDDGHIQLRPLSFGVGTGDIVMNIALNGQNKLVHAVADADFRHVDLTRIMQSTGVFHGAGVIGGHVDLDTTGNSMADMMGRGNGNVHLYMQGGNLSAILVDLAGLQFGDTLLSALGVPSTANIRCMISNFALTDGELQTKLLLLDTTEANVVGKGDIHLKNQTIDYQLSTDPKHFTIGGLPAPIDITGALKNPSIKPDPVVLGERGGAAVVLGVLLTPIAALIPTIDLGLGKDTDCHETVRQIQQAAATDAHKATQHLRQVAAPTHHTPSAEERSETPMPARAAAGEDVPAHQ